MAKRWKWVRTILSNVGYTTIESLENVTILKIDGDTTTGYLDWSDGGTNYKADINDTTKTPVS